MPKLHNLPSMPLVEALEITGAQIIFGGLTKTLLEAPSEAAAIQTVHQLQSTAKQVDYCFNTKRHAWYVTVYH